MSRPVALVTGANSAIGSAIARRLAVTHDLALAVRPERRDTVPEDLPGRVETLEADLSEADAPAALVAETMARFGRIDALVNNAAGFATTDPLDVVPGAVLDLLAVNVAAPMALISAAAAYLPRGGAVVNISSINARAAATDASAYVASKAALEAATRALARDLGPRGIRVNAVQPGAIERPDAPRPPEVVAVFVAETWLARVGIPEDIAGPVAFLLSEDAGWITGEVLCVAGGFRR
ncbi:MAG: SDR family oxidoreductase [Jannaschia sp.]